MITVYTQPGCVPCKLTAAILLDGGFEHHVVDVTKDPEGMAYLKRIGATSVPVVKIDGELPIIGFHPDLLKERLRDRLDIKPTAIHDYVYEGEDDE